VVRDGVEGFIRPYDDLDGYAAAIEKLWKDKNLRAQMAKRARQRAEAFELDYYTRELTTLLTRQAAAK
jgi:glycosyltransferase involved in cell wall biosynthesis